MQADVFTAFLTDKVKVFATKKGVKPFTMPKKYIRKAYPFLLCSAMIFTGCAKSTPNNNTSNENTHPTEIIETPPKQAFNSVTLAQSLNTSKDTIIVNWSKIYKEVIKTYRLNQLKDKIPFSKQEILNLMKTPNPPSLYDINFNHCVANQENFWDIVRNGIDIINNDVQNSNLLTKNQKKEYKITAFKMLSQMSKYKGSENEVDISDYNNKKTFLFFEKIIRYKDDYDEVFLGYNNKSFCDERNEFIGRYYKDFEELVKTVEDYPNVENFIYALYMNNDRFIITPQDSVQANAISKKMFDDFLKKQNIKERNIYELVDSIHTAMDYNYLRGSKFIATIHINNKGQLNYGKIAPIWSLAIHEIQHGLALNPASNEAPEHNHLSDSEAKKLKLDTFNESYLGELGPTLSSLARDDQIYKKIHNITPYTVVDYGVTIDTGKQKIPLGEIAVWWWDIEQKSPYKSIDKTLSQKEVMKQLDAWGNENTTTNTHINIHYIPPQAEK